MHTCGYFGDTFCLLGIFYILGDVLIFQELFDNLVFCEFETFVDAWTFQELFDILEDTLAFLKLFDISGDSLAFQEHFRGKLGGSRNTSYFGTHFVILGFLDISAPNLIILPCIIILS